MATILIADDMMPVAEAMQLALARQGHDCVLVGDGDAALAAIEGQRFDLLVLDVWMPRRSGLEVLKQVRATQPDLPVVLVSGGGSGATLEQATAVADLYRADRMLYKPFEDEELVQAIASLLAQ
jgi:CheY-like chemotaxis protein